VTYIGAQNQPRPEAAVSRDADTEDRSAARRARARRRQPRRLEIDTTIPSPCITICQMDDQSGFCIGCFRTLDEIRDWMIMTAEQKRQVLQQLEQRRAAD
jgi:predicted Fe-S protein YdhL (DUF1289 family)